MLPLVCIFYVYFKFNSRFSNNVSLVCESMAKGRKSRISSSEVTFVTFFCQLRSERSALATVMGFTKSQTLSGDLAKISNRTSARFPLENSPFHPTPPSLTRLYVPSSH